MMKFYKNLFWLSWKEYMWPDCLIKFISFEQDKLGVLDLE